MEEGKKRPQGGRSCRASWHTLVMLCSWQGRHMVIMKCGIQAIKI